ADGKPVGNVHVHARPIATGDAFDFGESSVRTNDDGSFTRQGVRAGDYRVMADHDRWWCDGMRNPCADDDATQVERAPVVAAQSASVRVLVESQSGVITDPVTDFDGKPVPDAFVVAARESARAGAERSAVGDTRWTADDNRVLTAVDGSFTCTRL